MVKGLRSFNRKMREIPEAARQAARDALEKSAVEIVAFQQALAPVGETGDLRASISWTWGNTPSGAFGTGSVQSRDGDEAITIYAGGSDAYYAFFQEFGTYKMPAQPFFYPAHRAFRRRARGRITRQIRKAIRNAVR